MSDDYDVDLFLEECTSVMKSGKCMFTIQEIEFLENITNRWKNGSPLTEKQIETLQKLYDKL